MPADAIDAQLKDAGRQPGIEIWRIVQFRLEKLPEEQHGNFYVGDSYIILYTKFRGRWNVHFWLGNETTIDEQGTAAIKTVELDDGLGGLPVQFREVQGHESALFLSYFKDGIRYLKGGAASGFQHVKENNFENWQPRLLHCKGKRNVRCTQVDCTRKSLNLGDVFILDCGLQIYVWMPPESGRLERIKGMRQARSIRDQERAGRPQIHVLDQDWDKNEEFWKKMGGPADIADLKSAEEGGTDENYWRTNRQQVTLWRVSDESGKMQITKVSQGNFKSSQLKSEDAFVLDAGRGGIYVWVGKGCTMDERKKAMQWGQEYLKKENKPTYTQVVRVLEGAEPVIFTQWASNWERGATVANFKPRLYQCSDERGHLVVEEIAKFAQEDLDGDDVMILDALNTIYVWVGMNANPNEKKHAVRTAQKYLETDSIPRHNPIIETIYQGEETPGFKKLFKSWDDKLFDPETRSFENMRKLLFSNV
uniref:Gelsolin-like domain-containing protein n=2 Tax=Parascaris univalens TaxID=6257 RepID=A0A915C0I0_PARUN